MKTIKLKGKGQIIEKSKTIPVYEIEVPHEDSKISFEFPFYGPNFFISVMREINSNDLLLPTTSQVLSLVDLAMQNSNESHCAEILNKFENGYLWTATENLYCPEGVIIYDNVNETILETEEELLKLLKVKDPRVRFVKKGYKSGSMSIKKALKNPYVIAQIGDKNLDVFKRVANNIVEEVVNVCGSKGIDHNEQYRGQSKGDNRQTSMEKTTYMYDQFYLNGNRDCESNGGYALGVVSTI